MYRPVRPLAIAWRIEVRATEEDDIHGNVVGDHLDEPAQVPDYALVPLDVAEAYYYPSYGPDVDLSIAGHRDDDFEDWPIVEARGTFDHPAAMTCRNTTGYETPGLPEPDPAATTFGCRARFLVTSIRPNGFETV